MINNITIEICIGNIDDAIKASQYPIDRIELNSALELGGLSPSLETIRILKERIDTSLCCMCRPRGGDFCYTELEYQCMLKDAENMLKACADGIVFGFLKEDKTIDIERTRTMTDLIHSYQKEAIFHKAFDETPDLESSIQALIECGIDRILTSGAAIYPDILEGCKRIYDLQDRYGKQISLLPGGGVRIDNIREVLSISHCGQVHMTSKMKDPGDYLRLDEKQLQEMLKRISSM